MSGLILPANHFNPDHTTGINIVLKRYLCPAYLLLTLFSAPPVFAIDNVLLFIDPGNSISKQPELAKWRQAGFQVHALANCQQKELPGQCVVDAVGRIAHANSKSNSDTGGLANFVLLAPAAGAPALLSALALPHTPATKVITSAIILADAPLDTTAVPANNKASNIPLTVMVEATNNTASLSAARQHNRALQRARFNASLFVAPPLQDNLFEVNRERSALITIVAQLTNSQKPRNIFEVVIRRQHQWQQPPLDNKPFYSQFAYLKKYPVDEELKRLFGTHLESEQHLLAQFPQENYLAFRLLPYLQKRESLSPGDTDKGFVYMQTHNRSIINLDLSQYAQYEPVIVLALDDEKNLFRLPTFFKTKRQYSWREAEPTRLSARVLGAFLHFRKPVPEPLYIALNKRIAIRYDGIEYHRSNPLAVLQDIPDNVLSTIEGNCIYCHQVRNVGGYAGHLNAATGKLQGGFALPLESYPTDVLQAFLFNQRAVAKKIGVNPNLLPEPAARALFDWLKQEKQD